MSDPGSRLAVVLFNLGGPDRSSDVGPFLQNLFSDPAIFRGPAPVRFVLSRLIATMRRRSAQANYALLGGGSPLLAETLAQAEALENALAGPVTGVDIRVFVAMRHWSPRARAVANAVDAFQPRRIVLLPLYPQYSTTTSASSLKEWERAYAGPGETHAVCCWHDAAGLVEAHAQAILSTWRAAGSPRVRLLFSAHGLPSKIDKDGDPYRWQVERTCAAVAARLGEAWNWRLCYQSRVGPMKWLAPSTPDVIRQAGRDGVGVLIDPIAFVSEHVETLVELDRDYASLAKASGVPVYLRAPAVGVSDPFIRGLADVVERALQRPPGVACHGETCPRRLMRCPMGNREAPPCSST